MGKSFDTDTRQTFGKRRIAPRACVLDSKPHLQTFLSEALEELGFIVCRCASADGLGHALKSHYPDLIVFGLSAGGVEAARSLDIAAAQAFKGKVLLLGPALSPMVTAVRSLGEKLGLAMLPVLTTPFADRDLRKAVFSMLPAELPPTPPFDATEALDSGWLELWYQPKIDTRSLVPDGAAALMRIRHPTWGVMPPAHFIPADDDPHFQALSTFVIGQAVDDWRYLVSRRGRIQLAINLPLSFFRSRGAAQHLCQMLPKHGAFDGLIVEMDGSEVTQNLSFSTELAGALRFHNIGISIDVQSEDWPSLIEATDFPFVEIKLDRKFVDGCADNRLARTACRQMVEFAQVSGARTVADGVESRNDFLVLREMGVDMIQGPLFAKPMLAQKFAKFTLNLSQALS